MPHGIVVAAVLAIGCAPPAVEPRAITVSPPSIHALIGDLPGVTPSGSASALEARLRRLTAACSNARVARVSSTEVHADAGAGCPSARGALSATFAYQRGGVAVTIRFEQWSLADGDVLHGGWQGHAVDRDATFEYEELPFAQRAVSDPPLDPDPDPLTLVSQSAADRCLNGLGAGMLASSELIAAAPVLILAWPLLLAPPLVGLAAGCKK